MPIVCPTSDSGTQQPECIAGGTASAGNVIHIEVVIPQRTAGSDATRLDTTMLVFTGSRNAPRASNHDLLHRAGLTLPRTTPTASQLNILQATSAQDGQR